MSNGVQAHLLGRSGGKPIVLTLGEVAVAAVTAVCMGALLYVGWLPALAVAGVATLAICAVTWPRAFRIAAYAAVVVLPFVSAWPVLRPNEYSYPTYLAALLLVLVGLGAFQPRMFTASIGSLYLAYVALAGAIALIGSYGLERLPELTYLVSGFAIYTLIRRADHGERQLIVLLVISLGVIQSSLAITQALFGWPVFEAVLPDLMASERNYFAYLIPGLSRLVTQGSGTFAHFNALGALLSLCLPLAFGFWLTSRRSRLRLAAVAVTTCGVIATFSRGALFGALAGTLFVLWFGPSRSRRASIVLLLCFATLVALLGASVASQYFETTQNLTIRVQTWQAALDDALNRPSNLIAGYGYGHFHTEVLNAGLGGGTLTRQSSYMASLHSGYIQLLLEFGAIATVLLAIWIASALGRLRAAVPPLVVPVLGGALGLLCSQALDNALFSYAGVLFVALMAVLEGEAADGSHAHRSTSSTALDSTET